MCQRVFVLLMVKFMFVGTTLQHQSLIKYLNPNDGNGYDLFYFDGDTVRDEKWRFDSQTGYTAFSRRDGFRLADMFYLVDSISDEAGMATKSYILRNNIASLLNDRVKEPLIPAFGVPSQHRYRNEHEILRPAQQSHVHQPTYVSFSPHGSHNMRWLKRDKDHTDQQKNSPNVQPFYNAEQALDLKTNNQYPPIASSTSVALKQNVDFAFPTEPPISDSINMISMGAESPLGIGNNNDNIETTTRRKIEGLPDEDEDVGFDDPLGNRINPTVLKSLLG